MVLKKNQLEIPEVKGVIIEIKNSAEYTWLDTLKRELVGRYYWECGPEISKWNRQNKKLQVRNTRVDQEASKHA